MNIYQRNIQKYQATGSKLAGKLKELSIYRLVVFIFSLIIITVLANQRLIDILLFVAPLCMLGFGLLVKRYNRIAYQKRHTMFLEKINEQEVLRLENKLSEFPEGQKFANRHHSYASDLDIFGSHSLFQLLNRTTTESGMESLADWLSFLAAKDIILERQQAIKELTPKLDWRQDFQASGMHHSNVKSDYKKLLSWIERPLKLIPSQSFYLIASMVLALLATLASIYILVSDFHILSLIPLFAILAINIFLLRRIGPMAEEIVESTYNNLKVLGGYESLILKIEAQEFHAQSLARLQSAFRDNSYSAAREINKLKKILDVFQQRGTKTESTGMNFFYPFLNVFWLLDVYLVILTEKWKKRNRSHLRVWASAVSEFEVLCSLAGFSYSNPSCAFPQITEESYKLSYEKLGHPLIDQKNRVYNNFSLQGRGGIAMITGSNMSGKSTFLRTVGVNLVLALMGAPCCSVSAQVSNMKVFTSLRTEDNLEEGISSFYAELLRIEQLLKLIAGREPILFLLDEMFKGTNSDDRHKGGVSLIRQLRELNAFGIIATHDLELAKLSDKHKIATNYSFNSKIEDGRMIFNYELSEGICTDFNASELMKISGINVISDSEEI